MWQARLIMLVMINIAQLWILAATVDAALARHYSVLLPLVIASGVCFPITLSIIKWWRPTSRRKTSSGYVRDNSMKQKITGFDKDDEDHWRAVLECGHRQHVRHDPPMTTRPGF